MTDAGDRGVPEGMFVLDRAFVASQAREGIATFFAPFSGIVQAVRGQSTDADAGSRPAASALR